MSGFVLSALILLAILLPGLILLLSFQMATSNWDTSIAVDPGSVTALLLALPVALVIHVLWGPVVWVADQILGTGLIDFAALLAVIQGTEIDFDISILDEQLGGTLLFKAAVYVWSQGVFAFFLGLVLAEWAEKVGWARYIALSSSGGWWHRQFRYSELSPDWIILSVTLTLGSQTYLYYGLLNDYEVLPSGKLKFVNLSGAVRRKIDGTDTHPIPGENFIIDCEQVETFDVDYFFIEKDTLERGDPADDDK